MYRLILIERALSQTPRQPDKEMKMAKIEKSLSEKIAEADVRGGRLLADANEASERGNQAKAEKLYERGQYWLDRSNKLRGNS